MEIIYDIFLEKKSVGKAKVEIRGLYYCFDCVCHIAKGKLCRLVVSCGEKEESLGICVPKAGSFGLETRLPVKRLGRGELSFRVITNEEQSKGKYVPIHTDKPFSYISRLDTACLEIVGENYGVRVYEH